MACGSIHTAIWKPQTFVDPQILVLWMIGLRSSHELGKQECRDLW